MKTLYAVRDLPLGDPASCVSPEVKPCRQGHTYCAGTVYGLSFSGGFALGTDWIPLSAKLTCVRI